MELEGNYTSDAAECRGTGRMDHDDAFDIENTISCHQATLHVKVGTPEGIGQLRLLCTSFTQAVGIEVVFTPCEFIGYFKQEPGVLVTLTKATVSVTRPATLDANAQKLAKMVLMQFTEHREIFIVTNLRSTTVKRKA